ncbi:MAG: hypothetical protein RR549_03245, partial [Oscillospiraceae bacterium]
MIKNIVVNFTLKRKNILKSNDDIYKLKYILRKKGIPSRYLRDKMLNFIINLFFENNFIYEIVLIKVYTIEKKYFLFLNIKQ